MLSLGMSEYTCQSCGLGIDDESMLGTYPDGRKNADYCIHCFRDGGFTHPDITMEEQIELNISGDSLEEFNRKEDVSFSSAGARNVMAMYFPRLKRWMDTERKIGWMLERIGYAVLSTLSEEGYPRPSAVDIIARHDIRELWMTTHSSSAKAGNIRRDPRTGLCFVHEADSVSLTGTAGIISDKENLERFWEDRMLRYFPLGLDDPEYCLIRFRPDHASFWIDGARGELTIG